MKKRTVPAILILAIEQRMSLTRLAMATQTGFMFYKSILKPKLELLARCINIYLIREVVLKNHKIYFIEEIQTQIFSCAVKFFRSFVDGLIHSSELHLTAVTAK